MRSEPGAVMNDLSWVRRAVLQATGRSYSAGKLFEPITMFRVSRCATAGALTEPVVAHLDRGRRCDLPVTRRFIRPQTMITSQLTQPS
jgi:hypothetical protein